MAPRRGGGGGGYGGGSSGIDDTPWGELVSLSGAPFADPYATAQTVFEGIGTVGFIAILIWASTSRLPHPPPWKLFRWFAFWLSATMVFVTFAMQFANDIMYGVEAIVQQIYYLIATIIYQSAYISEISLLGVLHHLLPYCSVYPGQQGHQAQVWKGPQAAHAALIVILVALWISAMALKIKFQVQLVLGYSWDYDASDYRPFQKIDTAYAILYFLASLEIVGWSVLGLVNARKSPGNGRVQILLVTLVAAPLLLRSAYSMGDTIYEELQQHYANNRLQLASDIIYVLTSLLIYTGIVAIARYIGGANHSSPPNPNHIDPSYDPNFWGGTGSQGPNFDPKTQMAVHEAAPPYQHHTHYPGPMQQQQLSGHPLPIDGGGMQYAPQPQQPQPYPNQSPYHQPPYQNSAPIQYQHQQQHQQPYQSPPGSPQYAAQPPQHHALVQGRDAPPPLEMNGGSTVSELSSPITTAHAHAVR